MKKSITSIAKVAGGMALMAASGAAMASVTNTVHNLSADGTATHMVGPSATTEICIFCHTPHGGDQSVNAPLWNRSVSSTSVYTRFSNLGRITFDATEAPVGGVSIACLSCHDGTQARDAVINGPGGGPNNNWAGGIGGTGQAGTWVDGTSTSTAYLSALAPSDNGSLSGDLIYLGTDLRNDHPISMQYGGGGLTIANGGALTGVITVDPDFAQYNAGSTGGYGTSAASTATTGTNAGVTGTATGAINVKTLANGGSMFYIDTGTAGYQANDFPLYTRNDGVAGGDQPMVECGTCHDPHSSNEIFLRLPSNEGSQVCLTCHAK
jgi:predicted CXXCH cytochrome family protein